MQMYVRPTWQLAVWSNTAVSVLCWNKFSGGSSLGQGLQILLISQILKHFTQQFFPPLLL